MEALAQMQPDEISRTAIWDKSKLNLGEISIRTKATMWKSKGSNVKKPQNVAKPSFQEYRKMVAIPYETLGFQVAYGPLDEFIDRHEVVNPMHRENSHDW